MSPVPLTYSRLRPRTGCLWWYQLHVRHDMDGIDDLFRHIQPWPHTFTNYLQCYKLKGVCDADFAWRCNWRMRDFSTDRVSFGDRTLFGWSISSALSVSHFIACLIKRSMIATTITKEKGSMSNGLHTKRSQTLHPQSVPLLCWGVETAIKAGGFTLLRRALPAPSKGIIRFDVFSPSSMLVECKLS